MSEGNQGEQGGQEGQPKRIIVNVEGAKKDIDKVLEDKRKIEEDAKKKEAELKLKIAELEKDSKKADEYKQILDDLAKKAYEEKREKLTTMLEEQRATVGDEKIDELLNEIEEGEDPEKLERIFFQIQTLTNAMTYAQQKMEQDLKDQGLVFEKKEDGTVVVPSGEQPKKPSTGIVSLLPKISRREEADIFKRQYDNFEDMAHDLYKEWRAEKNEDRKKKLNDAINKLWEMLWHAERKEYKSKGEIPTIGEMILSEEDKEALKRKGKL